MKQKFYLAGFLTFVLMSALLLSVNFVQPTDAQSDVSNYDNVRTSGYVQAGTDVIAADDVTVGGHLGYTPQTAIVVTNNSTITPTGGLQYLSSAAARGTRLVITTTLTAGTMQIFRVATGSSSVTLTDTAPLCLAGNAVLGAGDTLGLLHNGVCWEQLWKSDN